MLGRILSTSGPHYGRAKRLLLAADGASRSISSLSAEGTFGPLGETLVWLVAIDDLLASCEGTYRARRDADPDGAALPGIRYARNAVVHGEMVSSTTYAKPGAVLGAAALGTFALGEGPSTRWLDRASIAHTPKSTKHLAPQEQSYDSHLAGRDVHEPVRAAAAFLTDAVG
jgi:hypothetical protein